MVRQSDVRDDHGLLVLHLLCHVGFGLVLFCLEIPLENWLVDSTEALSCIDGWDKFRRFVLQSLEYFLQCIAQIIHDKEKVPLKFRWHLIKLVQTGRIRRKQSVHPFPQTLK